MNIHSDLDDLFSHAMKGQWDEVSKIYKKSVAAQKAKLTKSEDTALHIAVSVGQTDVVMKLVEMSEKDILEIANVKGDTALHLAAALGNLLVCKSMVSKNPGLLTMRNQKGETPLFLAARHGKKEAFIYLHSLGKEDSNVRRNDGDTILHATIYGEYFGLANSIIHWHPTLADAVNENGLSPLHLLARKPNAFRSSCRLGLFERIIYHCLVVDELKYETDENVEEYLAKRSKKLKEIHKYPENYKTCISFFTLISVVFQVLFNKLVIKTWVVLSLCGLKQSVCKGPMEGKKDGMKTSDEENPQLHFISSHEVGTSNQASSSTPSSESSCEKGRQGQENKTGSSSSQGKNSRDHQIRGNEGRRYFPPNYDSLVLFVNVVMKALLIILGIGIGRIKKIQRKKELHMLAKLVMDELVKNTTSYKFYDNTGLDPHQTQARIELDHEFGDPFAAPTSLTSESGKNLMLSTTPSFNREHEKERGQKYEAVKQHTPILIAAKNGVTEMVKKILQEFPIAIQDLDSDNKNVVLLAVEHRQPQIYSLLLNSKILKESVFQQLDKDGNSALHLAAECKEHRPWLIPGVALQMQWEIKWYKFVKKSMPTGFFPRYNNKHETAKEVFIATHKELTKEGGKWLVTTSESCSVVAALVATVAFATSAAVPGGTDETTGLPLLMGNPTFKAFAISSLVALCFSITALVFFLSILTSRCQEKDFEADLPRKLLLGLTSLFASIPSMLVSFCDGHIFILADKLKFVAYPLYAALCFPITYFAFAQLSLYLDLVWAIFRKVPQRSNKAFLH